MKKEYELSQSEKNKVQEPVISYQTQNDYSMHNPISLMQRKAELVQSILNDLNDDETLFQLEKFYIELTHSQPIPCRYSIEELKERTKIAICEAKEGKVTSMEEMKKRFES